MRFLKFLARYLQHYNLLYLGYLTFNSIILSHYVGI